MDCYLRHHEQQKYNIVIIRLKENTVSDVVKLVFTSLYELSNYIFNVRYSVFIIRTGIC